MKHSRKLIPILFLMFQIASVFAPFASAEFVRIENENRFEMHPEIDQFAAVNGLDVVSFDLVDRIDEEPVELVVVRDIRLERVLVGQAATRGDLDAEGDHEQHKPSGHGAISREESVPK